MTSQSFEWSAARLSRGRLVGTLRLWHVSAGGVRALVLGPLAVDPSCRELGLGATLMNHALAAAAADAGADGERAVAAAA